MTDDVLGTITGTATFETVELLKVDDGKMRVVGVYHGDSTTYETDANRVRLFGHEIMYLEHSMAIEADENEWIEVEATKDRLYIDKHE